MSRAICDEPTTATAAATASKERPIVLPVGRSYTCQIQTPKKAAGGGKETRGNDVCSSREVQKSVTYTQGHGLNKHGDIEVGL